MSKLLLILGYGKNVGSSTAALFAKNGYKVVVASRSGAPSLEGYTPIKLDLSDPEATAQAVNDVVSNVGVPSVVLYNAGVAKFTANPLTEIPLSTFDQHLRVNFTSAYAAVQQVFKHNPKVIFLYTGNAMNESGEFMPRGLSQGVGKAASAHLIQALAKLYSSKGAMFYYVDERTPEGDAVYSAISGLGHAQFFWDLVRAKEQSDAVVTFVSGQGARKF